MLTGRHDCDYVEVVGVVQRAWLSSDPQMHTLFADVAFEDGIVRAAFWDYTPADLERFIDARVRLRGNVGTLFGRTEQLRGVSLFVGHSSDIEVLEPPPEPFLDYQRARSAASTTTRAAGEVNRRIRVRGVVTGYIPGRPIEVSDFTSTTTFRYIRHVLYVDDGTGGARIETEQPQHAPAGHGRRGRRLPGGHAGETDPDERDLPRRRRGAAAGALAVGNANVLTPDNDATLVRMEGHFLSFLTSPTQRILVLKVGETVFDAVLDTAAASAALERIRPGSLVAVTGVYSYQWGPPPTSGCFSDRRVTCRSFGAALVDAPPHRGDGRHARARRRRLQLLGQGDVATGSGSSTRRCSTSAAASRVSCTTRWSRGLPASPCSSKPSLGACRRRPKPRASLSTSRGRCCATARKKRADRSWTSVAGAREPRPGRGARRYRAADDARHRRGRRGAGRGCRCSDSEPPTSTTCCGSVSRRSPTR